MKTIYSGTWVNFLVKNIQEPLKQTLNLLEDKSITPKDAFRVLRFLKDLMALPEPTKENTREHNAHILIDIRDEFMQRMTPRFYGAYHKIFKVLFNYAIVKYDYDRFYQQCIDWCFGEALRRDWQLQGYNRPSSELWHTILPATRERLIKSITNWYNILQERCKTIDNNPEDSEAIKASKKQSRFEQFTNNVLREMELEVETWRG